MPGLPLDGSLRGAPVGVVLVLDDDDGAVGELRRGVREPVGEEDAW